MGVPAFFRWLTRKYPSVIIQCIEEGNPEVDGVKAPVDASKPNPNGVEFDNLYLDMNGIIHPCTHPEDKPAPKNEDEMMIAIFECIDRLFAIVRPRKLLYMAIDGVAPRAKMNQQRSRRFRASKETAEKIETMERIREELEAKGMYLPPQKQKDSHFDSNCITPGTPFMARLSVCLMYYVHDRLNNDPAWKNVKVILSDANVPGEGEHKIMDFIRKQRSQPDHDPNTQHVLCGADADLIMLGLATHEPNFTIIREEFKPNKPRPCDLCRQMGHEIHECQGAAKPLDGEDYVGEDQKIYEEQKFIFVRLSVLREYLRRDLQMPNLPFPYDFERVIDDWVFMCFFVGNDFLPHLPSLEIREGAIDRLVNLYKKSVYKTGGFLTDSGMVNPERVQLIMQDLGEMEDHIFKERQRRELDFRARNKANKRRSQGHLNKAPAWVPQGQFAPKPLMGDRDDQRLKNVRQEAAEMRIKGMQISSNSGGGSNTTHSNLSRMDSGTALKGMIREEGGDRGVKRSAPQDEEEDDEPPDEVRLWEDGFKDRYYESKFDVGTEDREFRYRIAAEYTIGLCWVLRYYYQGCSSWKWYFPYHYAPFASDFVNIGDIENKFEKGTRPFKPMEQLMSVFPAASRQHVPDTWGELMIDPMGPIIDFYPVDFKIDLNGKKYAWQGVALLPFVDEERLHKALEPVYPHLTAEEIARNVRGDDRIFLREGHPGHSVLASIWSDDLERDQEVPIPAGLFQGMTGNVLWSRDCVEPQGTFKTPVYGLKPLEGNRVICARYRDPKYPEDFIFPSRRLEGAKDPPTVLKPGDLTERGSREWKPRMGFTERRDQASLGGAGHRMLGHHTPRGGGGYGAPPALVGDFVFQDGEMSGRGRGRGASYGGRGGGYDGGYGGRGGGQDGGYGGRNYGGSFGRGGNRGGGGYDNRGRGGGGGYQGGGQEGGGRYQSRGGSGGGGYQGHGGGGGGGYQGHGGGGGSGNQGRGGGGGYQGRGGDGSGGYQSRGGGGGGYYTSGYNR
ncbi:5'-3' exoribonuclease 2 homolog [Eurytemora carolleeae]|uniref:5'-3' exoribonuclease 2 homolog n=1 Tax=Eurytemora carolleeae TaxID=1294199 RepID=UPI000C78E262|nr:5'-3' exoribonuclease 2 homolog [Eurytemora carolleeae]XP_023328404.1 5'-3' exoribonuclease 2 homolog [Eurytemora carolleeae]XP_023328405.1 5'-3' exoribonuclease 2 homolog [Eurytemora carolleeae]XP_023328406.1 5'-3' exoribonuclease 2 homolog [Eurytemora carolleeae]|eukprot:XP_023328403.1 5'-3' exoribonuclease 2 homolog [Eurytemora affinis]